MRKEVSKVSINLEEQYDKIYRYCYMKTNHKQIAEDITQESFLRFLENKSYHNMGKRLAYLYTIAKNLCVDYYRKKEFLQLQEDLLIEDKEEERINSFVLRNAIQSLDQSDQELIFLRYVNEISVADISRILHLSRFTVYRRTNQCLKQLKEQLGKEDYF